MSAPSTADRAKVAALREALPAVAAGIYLNTPVAGPLPAETAAAMAEIAEWELRTGRAHRHRADEVRGRVDEALAAAAAILGVGLDEVTLAHGHGHAVARVLAAARLGPRDHVLELDEPLIPPGLVPEARRGQAPLGAADPVADVSRAWRPGTRLVTLPLVSPLTGTLWPAAEIVRVAHERGADVLLDVALAAAACPIDPDALGADLLVTRSDAWLLGPSGLAVVAGRGDLFRRLALEGTAGPEPSEFHLPSVVGFARGCGWLSMYVGLGWLHERGRTLTDYAAARLAGIDGVELLTPAQRATTLVFRVARWRPDAALDELGARTFLMASAVETLGAIRIGIGFWNTEDEVDRVAESVALLAGHTPKTLPRRPVLTVLGGT